MISFTSPGKGVARLTCESCKKSVELFNWMYADQWNEAVTKFQKEHEHEVNKVDWSTIKLPEGGTCVVNSNEEIQRLKQRINQLQEIVDEAVEGNEQSKKHMEDFLDEHFSKERNKTWKTPFTTRKFIELIRDRMAMYGAISIKGRTVPGNPRVRKS